VSAVSAKTRHLGVIDLSLSAQGKVEKGNRLYSFAWSQHRKQCRPCRDIHVHKVAGLLIVRNFVYIYGAPVKQSNRPGLFSRIYSLFAISLCILYSGSISTELVSDTEGSTPSRYCRKKTILHRL